MSSTSADEVPFDTRARTTSQTRSCVAVFPRNSLRSSRVTWMGEAPSLEGATISTMGEASALVGATISTMGEASALVGGRRVESVMRTGGMDGPATWKGVAGKPEGEGHQGDGWGDEAERCGSQREGPEDEGRSRGVSAMGREAARGMKAGVRVSADGPQDESRVSAGRPQGCRSESRVSRPWVKE